MSTFTKEQVVYKFIESGFSVQINDEQQYEYSIDVSKNSISSGIFSYEIVASNQFQKEFEIESLSDLVNHVLSVFRKEKALRNA